MLREKCSGHSLRQHSFQTLCFSSKSSGSSSLFSPHTARIARLYSDHFYNKVKRKRIWKDWKVAISLSLSFVHNFFRRARAVWPQTASNQVSLDQDNMLLMLYKFLRILCWSSGICKYKNSSKSELIIFLFITQLCSCGKDSIKTNSSSTICRA